jgi:hypothetical protein
MRRNQFLRTERLPKPLLIRDHRMKNKSRPDRLNRRDPAGTSPAK